MLAASLDTSAGGFVNGRTRKPCATNLYFRCTFAGAVAQLGERLVRNEEVRGSIPLGSTTASPDTVAIFCLLRVLLPCEFWATRPPTRSLVLANSRPKAAGGT